MHKSANVLGALPKSAHPGARKALAEIWNAEDKNHARAAAKAFEAAYGTKFPKATAKIADDLEELLAFYDFPAEHWIHLRTTNPIESTFGHRPAPHEDHPRARLSSGWAGDGVQAHRGRPGPLAGGERSSPGRAGPYRRDMPALASRSTNQVAYVVVCTVLIGCGLSGVLLAPLSAPFLWVVLIGVGHGGAFALGLNLFVLRTHSVSDAAQLSAMAPSIGYTICAFGPLLVGVLNDVTGSWYRPLLLLVTLLIPQLVFGGRAGLRPDR